MKNKFGEVLIIVLLSIAVISAGFHFTHQSGIEQLNEQEERIEQAEADYQKDQTMPPSDLVQEMVAAAIKGEKLYITFDQGQNWQEVPKPLEQIQFGEYTPDVADLTADSHVLNQELGAFLTGQLDGQGATTLSLLSTRDQGKSWQESQIASGLPGVRFRKIAFVNETFGYVIISAGRVVRQEGTAVYVTHDQGDSWQEVNSAGVTSMVQAGGFIDEETGFLSYPSAEVGKSGLYVTQDGGEHWQMASVAVPEEYQKIFLIAETPFKEDDQLVVELNQGELGDYKGGLVKGRFLSSDNGLTWTFDREVNVDE